MPKQTTVKKATRVEDMADGLLIEVGEGVEIVDLSHPDNAALQASIDARGEALKAKKKR